ncbi:MULTISPECIES: Uma2 family endonuclease [unclassified Actinomadura]|uniref:Uma2 family endonuclease n=1 Tax=unclassified Actinomadura TaxID=2626254 RepID=UPI0011EBFC3B|nr:Uma2 family endonuclease [Actinomadura sp. K4S16]
MPLPVWAANPSCLLITIEEYEALPVEARLGIEIVDGGVIGCKGASPQERDVSRNLTTALRAARPAQADLEVLAGADVHFRESGRAPHRGEKHFTMRRPDISVARRKEPGAKLCSDDVMAAIEITSSVDITHFYDKRAEYAGQRIPVYLIVLMHGRRIVDVQEHRLDWSGCDYGLAAVHRGSLSTELPEGMKVNVAFSELEGV